MQTKYEFLSQEKYAELLTQLTAGLLASGHFTLPVTNDSDGNHITQDTESQIIRYFYPEIGGPGRGGYTGAPAAIEVAKEMLLNIMLEAESMDNDED